MIDILMILIQAMLVWYVANVALFFLHEWLDPGLIMTMKAVPDFEENIWTAILMLIHLYIPTVAVAKLHALFTKKS